MNPKADGDVSQAVRTIPDYVGMVKIALGEPSRPPWPDVLPEAMLGAIAVELAFDWTWVDRREYFIEFVDDSTVRRTARIHFTLPVRLPYEVEEGALIVVPLEILRKGDVLLHSEVRDADGALLSPLNKLANGRVAGLGLVAFFRKRIGNAFPPEAEPLMYALARGPANSAQESRGELLNLAAFHDYFSAADPNLSIKRANESKLLTSDLTEGFLHAVVVEYRPGLTHVVEVAYDVAQPWRDPEADGAIADADEANADGEAAQADEANVGGLRRIERLLIPLGALPRPLKLAPLDIGRAVSTHVELIAPADTDIVSARINAEQYDTATDSLESLAKPADKLSRSRADFHLPLRAGSEIVDESPEASRTRRELQVRGRTDSGSISVSLLPRASVVLAPITVLALVTSLALTAFAFSLSSLDGQTSAAILLLVPALVGAYVFRPGEHPYTTRALVGVRLVAVLSALCGFLVALMIAGQAFTGGRSPSQTVMPLPRTASPKRGRLSSHELSCRISSARVNLPAGDAQVVPRAVHCGPFVSRPPVSYEVRESEPPRVRPFWRGAEIFLAVLSGVSAVMLMLALGLGMLVRRLVR